MSDSRTPAPEKGTGAADTSTVPRGSGFARRLRVRRAASRELDRIEERVYGPRPKYPDVAA